MVKKQEEKKNNREDFPTEKRPTVTKRKITRDATKYADEGTTKHEMHNVIPTEKQALHSRKKI